MSTALERTAGLWRDVRRTTPRSLARHAALGLLGAGARATGRTARALARPRVHFLYLHHIFPDEEAGFRTLLDRLGRTHCFVSYEEAVHRVLAGPIDAPLVTFSFDDGLRSCLRAGQILAEFGARACFFVCPDAVGTTDPEGLAAFCRGRLEMPPTELLSWNEIEQLLGLGHEIGSHTSGHRLLSDLAPPELAAEVEGSRAALQARVGEVRHFAWPYGRFFHFSREAARCVFDAGYTSCASAERGCHVEARPGDPRQLCIRRDQLVAAWPQSHMDYLMTRSVERASGASNDWPDDLAPGGGGG